MLKHLCAQGLSAAACRGLVVRLAYSLSECRQSPHKATSSLTKGALQARAPPCPDITPPHTQMVASLGQVHQKPGLLWDWYRRLMEFSPHFTKCLPLNSLLLIFDVILQQVFCIKNGQGSGVGRGKGAHILLRGIYAVPFIHRNTNTNRAFFKAFRCWLGVGYIKSLLT